MRIGTFATTVAVMLLGTLAFAQSVSYDFDRSANFSAYTSYVWVPGTELADQLNHARVVRAIEAQLAAKGLTKIAEGTGADALVSYHASVDRNLRIDGYSSGWGGPFLGGLRSGHAIAQEVVSGTLVVDVIDANTRKIVWRGMVSSGLNRAATAEKRDRSMHRAAQKLFKNYPPKA